MRIETFVGHFYYFSTMCETQPSLENCNPYFFPFYVEDASIPVGICFLEVSTAMAKIFSVALCL